MDGFDQLLIEHMGTIRDGLGIDPSKVPTDQAAFNSTSWDDLARMSTNCASNGTSGYENLLGMTKDVAVSGMGTVKARLIGLNHDYPVNGGRAGFTFQLLDGLSTAGFSMNFSMTTEGGWRSCEMRTTHMKTLEKALPTDLQGLLKTILKKTNITGEGTSIVEDSEKLVLLSVREVFGSSDTTSEWWAGEGEQYEWYAVHNPSGKWWLRSIYIPGYFSFVNNGSLTGNVTNQEYMPAACFCI